MFGDKSTDRIKKRRQVKVTNKPCQSCITKDNVYDLLLAADYFDITFIKTECEKFLQDFQNDDEDIQ
jgi:hypothetical protein